LPSKIAFKLRDDGADMQRQPWPERGERIGFPKLGISEVESVRERLVQRRGFVLLDLRIPSVHARVGPAPDLFEFLLALSYLGWSLLLPLAPLLAALFALFEIFPCGLGVRHPAVADHAFGQGDRRRPVRLSAVHVVLMREAAAFRVLDAPALALFAPLDGGPQLAADHKAAYQAVTGPFNRNRAQTRVGHGAASDSR
jgi:hypothetical protein